MFILAERLDCIACTMVDVSELIKLQRKSRKRKAERDAVYIKKGPKS